MEPHQGGIKSSQGIEWVGHPLPMPKYIQQLSERFNVFANESGEIRVRLRSTGDIYRHMIASLMYLVNIRPHTVYAVNLLCEFMSQLTKTHLIAAKHVLRYLRGTISYGMRYASSVDMRM
jgi:hypothetical protein